MNFTVERRSTISTINHPDRHLGNPLDDLAEYLTSDFDRDRIFDLPNNSLKVALSADLLRRSYFIYLPHSRHGRISLNLQPAVDVAEMVTYYWRSQVWPARVAFHLFAILGEMCLGNGMHRAVGFIEQFTECRLGRLITDSRMSIPDKSSPWFSSTRAQMFGSLDERALVKQLATFQIFHEVGHFIGFRQAAQRGESFSVEEENDELECDDFACEELQIAYGESLGIEFMESSQVSIFLSILIWTLAEHLANLENVEFRARTFAALIQRSRVATVHVHRLGHRTKPPSERLDMEALRHFPVFDALLRILDMFFLEAVSNDAEIFDYQGPVDDTALVAPRASAAMSSEAMATSLASWESIWAKEDDVARRKLAIHK